MCIVHLPKNNLEIFFDDVTILGVVGPKNPPPKKKKKIGIFFFTSKMGVDRGLTPILVEIFFTKGVKWKKCIGGYFD